MSTYILISIKEGNLGGQFCFDFHASFFHIWPFVAQSYQKKRCPPAISLSPPLVSYLYSLFVIHFTKSKLIARSVAVLKLQEKMYYSLL